MTDPVTDTPEGSTTGRSGARVLVETAADGSVEVCFANPGTTEMPLVAALDAVPAVRAVLGLFEGVCTGAADGYARITGQPGDDAAPPGPGPRQRHSPTCTTPVAPTPPSSTSSGTTPAGTLPYDAPLTSRHRLAGDPGLRLGRHRRLRRADEPSAPPSALAAARTTARMRAPR